MEVFLLKMQQVLPVLGVEAFVSAVSTLASEEKREILTCKIKDITSTGYLTPNGIVVLAGSEAVLRERDSAKKYPAVLNQRNRLIEDKEIIEKEGRLIFTKDIEFSSPSAAAVVVHGGNANGLTAWKNGSGITLKELENV